MADEVISFTKVSLPWGWLGNMSPHPVEINGRTFPTTEHLFQSLRFSHDHPVIEEICSHKSPMRAKMIVKTHMSDFLITPRSREDIENMLAVLYLKVETYPELKYKLVETESKTIIEDVTARPDESGLYWGAKLTSSGWVGKNTLGKCWMQVRDYING
jgi:ribA/ribD-fused uncharacterized protein